MNSQILGKPLTDGFIKSSHSGGSCVAVRKLSDGGVEIANTNDPTRTTLTFTASAWEAFLLGVHDGEFEMSNLERVPSASCDT